MIQYCDICGDGIRPGEVRRRLLDEGSRGRPARDHVFCPTCAADYDHDHEEPAGQYDDEPGRPLRGFPPLEDH